MQKCKIHKHFPGKPSLTVCLWLKATADWHGNFRSIGLGLEQDLGLGFAPDMSDI
jgi:hypothetical protein